MRNIPVNLSGYNLMIMEPPVVKTRKSKDGTEEVVADNDGVVQFVVSVLVKTPGEKGEEIKVTLTTDPTVHGDDFSFGALVGLVDPTVSPYSFKNDKNETVSGIAFRAKGLTPLS